ncbi:MAG: HDOD domain-containing protein [Desulfamplus sp.]|nr:HDOD domain-containing protein [Desulfamplus sp.]
MPYKKLMAKIIAQEIIESGIKIPSLPDSAQRIMVMVNTPVDKIDTASLEHIIKNDPILFAQLLKLANSSYYSRGIPVTGLRNAIVRIGLTDTIHYLYMYLFKKTVPTFPNLNGFSDKEYWEEAWACAIANRRLGDPKLLVEVSPGDLYIVGLLQGIGKLILAVYNPEAFEKCIKMTKISGKPLREAELEIFATTDALVAQTILESWHLPDNICAAVGHWQSPESAAPEFREIAALTQFACSIVRISGLVRTCEWMARSSDDPFLTDLSNIYLFQNNIYPLARTGKQYRLVQEIVSLLEKHFAQINNINREQSAQKRALESKSNLQKTNMNKQERQDNKNIFKYSSEPERVKPKGFFDWIRSLFK